MIPLLRARLIHDVTFVASMQILEVFADCLSEEEQCDAFEQIYARLKAAIECFEIHNNRPERRLESGRN